VYASTGHTDVAKMGCFWLGIDRRGIDLLRGVDCDILAQSLIGLIRILILPMYTFFSGSSTAKNFGVKHAWPGAISGSMTN
jgi:hypothetical protein